MKLFRSPVAAVALLVIGLALLQFSPAWSTMYTWSKTAASNSNSDSTINWAEGMPPSAVNDSARAVMAAIAKYRDDNNGSLTTGGTSTAYTLTTNQVFASLAAMSGQSVRVKMSATNGASPTLNVDGLGARNIVSRTGVAIPTAALTSGAIYDFSYNNSSSEWFVVNAPVINVPSGSAFASYMSSCPSGWTKLGPVDNAAARIVTGSGGATAGTFDFTTVFSARTIDRTYLPNVTLTTALTSGAVTVTDPGHVHGGGGLYDANSTGGAASGGGITVVTAVNNSGNADTASATTGITAALANTAGTTSSINGGVGQAAMDFGVKYADFIICSKD